MRDPNPNRTGYKKTAVGWIPNDWECVRLGSVFTQSKKKGKKGLPVLSVTTDRGVIPRSQIDRKMAEDVSPDQSLLVEPGDLAYNMMRMWQGAVGVCGSSGVISPAYVVCRPLKTRVDPRYMVHLFKSHPGRHWLTSYSYGIHEDRLRLYYDGFALIQVPLPPLAEQHKIAAILSTWETAIEETRALIAAAKRRKTALMQQILTRTKRLSGFNDEWRIASMRNVCEPFLAGATPSTEKSLYWNGVIPWVSGADIGEGIIQYGRRAITEKAIQATKTLLCQPGDIAFLTRTGVGKWALVTRPMAVSQDITRIRFIPNHIDPQFGFYALTLTATRLASCKQGTSISGISKDDLESAQLPVPSLKEQRAIASILTTADDEIRQLEAKAGALERQKKGLMQKLLTGEIRTRQTR